MQLVLNKYGTSLSIEDGLFKVTSKDQEKKIPVEKVTSIILQRACKVTTDVLFDALDHEIEVLFFNKMGQPVGRIWSNKYGSISTIRKNQVKFSQSKAGAEWVKRLLTGKIENQIALLLTIGRPDGSTDNKIYKVIERLEGYAAKIKLAEGETIDEIAASLRGWEGNCSRIYFECVSNHLPDQYRFTERSKHPAFDMFNAMLNYAYGILYSKVEGVLIMAGIDPYLGVMHRDEYNRPVLVYDVIENFRIWADYIVVNLCIQQVMFKEFFDIENGVFYLNEHGKRILIQSANDFFEEIISMKGVSRSRNQHLLVFAQKLATKLKGIK
jgi:CRISPR-associated protein Cas1